MGEKEKEPKKSLKGKVVMCPVCGFKTDLLLPRNCEKCNVPLLPEKEATEKKKALDNWKEVNNLK